MAASESPLPLLKLLWHLLMTFTSRSMFSCSLYIYIYIYTYRERERFCQLDDWDLFILIILAARDGFLTELFPLIGFTVDKINCKHWFMLSYWIFCSFLVCTSLSLTTYCMQEREWKEILSFWMEMTLTKRKKVLWWR